MSPGIEHPANKTPRHAPRPPVEVPRKHLPARTDRCLRPPSDALLQAIEEFNHGQFFEQHETLEALWIVERDPVRYLYQGILQVGVGFYHWSRRNWKGAVAKLGQGLEKLEPYRPQCQSRIDVSASGVMPIWRSRWLKAQSSPR